MKILRAQISNEELKNISQTTYNNLVKAVVDIERNLISIDSELHSDLESLMIKNGSLQSNLWGINLYPDFDDDDFIEFDSMINLRPSQNNTSRSVDNKIIRQKISKVVNQWVKR